MQCKLTRKVVDTLEARTVRYNVTDSELPGLTLRVTPSGEKIYYYVYRHGKGRVGQKRWVRIGSHPSATPEIARREAQKLAASVVQGQDPAREAAENRKATTLGDVFKILLDEHVDTKCKPSTRKEAHRLAERHVFPVLGKFKLKDVTRRQVANLHHGLRSTPYLANRLLGTLSVFFAWASQNGYRADESNPCRLIKKFREQKRERFLSAEEMTRVGEAIAALEASEKINPLHAAALRLLFFTGARLSEILDLKWHEVDLEQGLLRLSDSKTGRKPIHLGAPALAVLRSIPRYSEEYVFPSYGVLGRVRNLRKTWVDVCAKAGLEGVRLHDLRHTFASVAASSGHSLPVVGAMLGHTQPSTTARYGHVAANPIHQAAEDTSGRIAKALSGGKVVRIGRRAG